MYNFKDEKLNFEKTGNEIIQIIIDNKRSHYKKQKMTTLNLNHKR